MEYNNNNEKNTETIFSKRLKAGKRRTYFFDVRTTRGGDYFIVLTESKKRFDENGFERHKLFLYKEDFNKFLNVLNETITHVKTELMPDFDFDAFNHDSEEEQKPTSTNISDNTPIQAPTANSNTTMDTTVDNW